jgi:hypothetical protein
MKTVTGSAAFHYLGTDYQYKTLLQYSGTINASGFLDGYIYILGELSCFSKNILMKTYFSLNRKW